MKCLTPLLMAAVSAVVGPALADTTLTAQLADGCALVGPTVDASAECQALRVAFRAEVGTCMDRLHAEADARSGHATSGNAHTSRARFLTCDAVTRAKMGLRSN